MLSSHTAHSILDLVRVPQRQDAAVFLMRACSFEEYSVYTWSLQCYPAPYVRSAESGYAGAEWIRRSGVSLIMYDHKPSTEPKCDGELDKCYSSLIFSLPFKTHLDSINLL